MAKTKEEILTEYPWIRQFERDFSEQCPGCDCGLGEVHMEGCTQSMCVKCGGQHAFCSCTGPDARSDTWIGLTTPRAFKAAAECDLWARVVIVANGVEYPMPVELYLVCARIKHENRSGLQVNFHVPCQREDPGLTLT